MKILCVILFSLISGVTISFSQLKKKKTEESKVQIPDLNKSVNGCDEVWPTLSHEKDSVIIVTDETPVFPGGQIAMKDWIEKNHVYPQDALEKGIEGRVYVSFIVDIDGSISMVSILRGLSPSCDKEAIRLVKTMPNWIPAKLNGKAIKMKHSIQIIFKL